MFPTTIWTTIRDAGDHDPEALERFAGEYRAPVRRFLERKGLAGADLEDVCQDVFLRLLSGRVLSKADRDRGRFRSLLLSVATHVVLDRLRKRRETPSETLEPVDRDPDFDREWTLELIEKSMSRLREEGSPYYEVLRGHLSGQPQNRNKLWIARQKLIALIRQQVALTVRSREEFEEEIRYLSRFVRPMQKDLEKE